MGALLKLFAKALPFVSSNVGRFFKSKDAKERSIADWETEAIKASKGSWKDEFLTLCFASPIVLQVIGAVVYSVTVKRTIYDNFTKSECFEYAAAINNASVNYAEWAANKCMISVGNTALLDAADMIYNSFSRVGLDYTQVMLLIISASFGVHVTRTVSKNRMAKAATELTKAKVQAGPPDHGNNK